jgi:hypothetical protein
MTDLQSLEEKISHLENRVKVLEEKLAALPDADDQEFMTALYDHAKKLAALHHPLSAVFLQKKLLIDHPRAQKLLNRLKAEGLI